MTDCPHAAPLGHGTCSNSSSSSSRGFGYILTLQTQRWGCPRNCPSEWQRPQGEASRSLAGSPEVGEAVSPPLIPGPGASSPIPRPVNSHFNIWHYCTLSWSPQSVWDVSLVCRGSQVTRSAAGVSHSLHRQVQLVGMVSWSAEPSDRSTRSSYICGLVGIRDHVAPSRLEKNQLATWVQR